MVEHQQLSSVAEQIRQKKVLGRLRASCLLQRTFALQGRPCNRPQAHFGMVDISPAHHELPTLCGFALWTAGGCHLQSKRTFTQCMVLYSQGLFDWACMCRCLQKAMSVSFCVRPRSNMCVFQRFITCSLDQCFAVVDDVLDLRICC